jgi:hypothetical protein
MRNSHSERSEAESRNPVECTFGLATECLDFARDDRHFAVAQQNPRRYILSAPDHDEI